MNKYQRGVLIGAGLAIAAYQVYGIAEDGLEYSKGWAVSFLIAAALLFVGLGDWSGLLGKMRGKAPASPALPPKPAAQPQSPPRSASAAPPKPDKHAYGVHVSELDLAIATAKNYAGKVQIFHPLQGNGRGLHWNACSMIYAAMRYAALKAKLNMHASIWNTIVRCVVVRMTTEGDDAVPMGNAGYEQLEGEAYQHLAIIDRSVDDALAGRGAYELEPVVKFLAAGFGARGEAVKGVAGGLGGFINNAHAKILPELLEDFS